MLEWITSVSAGHHFFTAYIIAVVILAVFYKQKRFTFVLPSVIVTIIIVNPLFYRIWDKLKLYAYWRILWIVPVIPVCAAVPAVIAEKCQKGAIKYIVTMGSIAVFILLGSFIYLHKGGSFVIPADNAEKLPNYVIRIADRLLEDNDHPRVIAEYPIGVYIRQYTSKIDSLYGRDIEGYILKSSNDAFEVHRTLNNPESDLENVAMFMLNNNYEYLILKDLERSQQLGKSQFELLDRVDEYGIYKVYGNPTVLNDRNELGQVIRKTNVNADGVPVDGENGIASFQYEYDELGYLIREFRTDAQGKAVIDIDGSCGFERSFDSYGNISMERLIGANGESVSNRLHFAEYRRRYQKNHLTHESFYDENGNLVEKLDVKYAERTLTWEDDEIIEEQYFDSHGFPVLSNGGYASCKRCYNAGKLIKEAYYGMDHNPILTAKGYASVMYSYDANGHLVREAFYGADEEPIDNINGYSIREIEYDASGNPVRERYKDALGQMVVTSAGYAEIRRTYNDRNLIIYEKYFGADNTPIMQAAGHVGIMQSFDENGHLIARTYLDEQDQPVVRQDGYMKAVWIPRGPVWKVEFQDDNGEAVLTDGINLATDIQMGLSGWSSWMTPEVNTDNYVFNIGTMNLGETAKGDVYSCQLEIEFRNVTATPGLPFRFWTQGAADKSWKYSNGWNNQIVSYETPPEDGVYTVEATFSVRESMLEVSTFDIGFRCDNWGSGSFRVRNVKIEKGEHPTVWSPGV